VSSMSDPVKTEEQTNGIAEALRGEHEDLKERTIGIDLFQKPVSHDTWVDPVVHVAASDARKRLLQYSGNAEVASSLRIEEDHVRE
jgi:hypothetical protein